MTAAARTRSLRTTRVLVVATATAAVGLAVIGAAAGSPLARSVRVGVVALVAAGTVGVLMRPGRRATSGAVLVVAAIAATIGGTVGARHAAVTGWSVRPVAGLAALAAALVVAVVVAVELVRGARRWWKLTAVPVAFLLVGFVVMPVAVALVATAGPPARLGSATPADRGMDFVEVTFPTADGVTLSGWYVPSRTGAAVVLLHGASSTRTAVLDHAVVLHRAGYGVLLFDARGHGRSGGRPMDLGWYGQLDTVAAVDLLTRTDGVDPTRIAVVGMSMGGEQAITAAAADPRIAAVVAEGAENRTFEDRDDWLPGGVNGWVQRAIDRVTFALIDVLTPARPPISLREAAARIAPRPILLIAGRGEERAARSIRQGAPAHVEIWESGTGHTEALTRFPEEWQARVVGFLDRAVGRG